MSSNGLDTNDEAINVSAAFLWVVAELHRGSVAKNILPSVVLSHPKADGPVGHLFTFTARLTPLAITDCFHFEKSGFMHMRLFKPFINR